MSICWPRVRAMSTPSAVVVAVWLAILSAILGAAPASAAPVISEARVGRHASLTRITLTLSAPVAFEVFTLGGPDRVVVDLPEVRWMPAAAAQPTDLVERVRHGRFKPGTSRVVVDCRTPVVVREATLLGSRREGWRLVIDIEGGGSAPAAAWSPSVATEPERAAPEDESPPTAEAPTVADPTLVAAEPAAPPVAAVPSAPVVGASVYESAMAVPYRTEPEIEPSPAGADAAPATLVFARPQPRPSVGGRRPAAQKWVVAVDPGHGGKDPGAIGRSGVYEKTITLAAARALRDELEALGRYRVVLTRNRDVFLRLRQRIAVARAADADLFVSLHADNMANRGVRGLSLYTLSERASDSEAAALAERENKVDLIGGLDLSRESADVADILIDLSLRETMNQSANLAALLVRELRKDTLLLPKAHRFAGFAVLKAPDVPSVLIELGYLSNPVDERLLRSAEHRRKLSRAIARAIDSYFVRFEAQGRL